jgi:hypothetical protein
MPGWDTSPELRGKGRVYCLSQSPHRSRTNLRRRRAISVDGVDRPTGSLAFTDTLEAVHIRSCQMPVCPQVNVKLKLYEADIR